MGLINLISYSEVGQSKVWLCGVQYCNVMLEENKNEKRKRKESRGCATTIVIR